MTITVSVSPLLKSEVYQHIRASYPPQALVPYPDMTAIPIVVAMDRWTPVQLHTFLRLWQSDLGIWTLYRRETKQPDLWGHNTAERITSIPLYEADGRYTRIAHEWLTGQPRPRL
jgi:hypothetical protein